MRNVLAFFLGTTMVAPLLLGRSVLAADEPKPAARAATAAKPDAGAPPGTPQLARPVPAAAGKDPAAAPAPNQEEYLRSVCIREDGIWASCPKGIFRASQAEKKWRPVALDIGAPLNGEFAQQPRDLDKLYYFTPRWLWDKPSADKKTYGLYRFDPSATKWEFLSSEYAFAHVYVHADGTVYAIVNSSGPYRGTTGYFNRIMMSTDAGRHWSDISNGIGHGVDLLGIFQDPTHKELVCLYGNAIRGYVLHAKNKDYKWELTREWEWHNPKDPDGEFFRFGEGGLSYYIQSATLSNYFDFPFGDRTERHAFQMSVGQSFTFKAGERVIVPVQIAFFAQGGATEKLPDMDDMRAMWGVMRIMPNGKREVVYPIRDEAKDRRGLNSYKVGNGQTYKRSLDLSAICDFSTPGLYRVKILYDCGWIAKQEHGEWAGRFGGPVFEVSVSQ
jgi:hypothetical protein